MKIRLTYWRDEYGTTQSGDEGGIEHHLELDNVTPQFLAGVTACPYGLWSVEEGESLLRVEVWRHGGWVRLTGEEIWTRHHRTIKVAEEEEEQNGDLIITYNGCDGLYRGVDQEFRRGLQYYSDEIEPIEMTEVTPNRRPTRPESLFAELQMLLATGALA